jgi:peptidoglycan hydrolase-like protein with peptidoglycan-binding domain
MAIKIRWRRRGSVAAVARKILTCAVMAAAGLTLVAGCSSGGLNTAAPGPASTTATAAQGPTATPTTAAADPSSANPAPTHSSPQPTTTPAPSKLKVGAKGAEVVALQQRLTELGYWNGKADGTFGSVTQQAVFALQKAAGLDRDGVVGTKTHQALTSGVRPKAQSRSGHVIEIDKKRQLLMIVDNGTISQIFNTSTGSGQNYEYQGNTYLASTPSGHFTASRQIDGWRNGPLGPLWRPKYFNGGIAVHGAPSVPPYPASHGCARLSVSAMDWIWANNQLPLKTKVWVY